MAMDKGSVTIAGDGSASGSGLAKEFYDAHLPKVDFGGLTGADTVNAKQAMADLFETVAEVVTHIQTNAEVATTGTASNVSAGGDTANTSSSGTVS